ncbi:biotin--protein ligase [Galendromus occidentalis]|uniref:Biotin--protein ligase n=1 Tax=Galendromus occidentalis TaxID=34638 RepID=A0AAJ7L7H7_9ACAR|nr:biotin--protein ligase [Galendromus occidentalis]
MLGFLRNQSSSECKRFWNQRVLNVMARNSIKPPNILVFGEEADTWKSRIERIVNTNLYLVYATSKTELESEVWVDNCRLLYLADLKEDQCSPKLKNNISNFINIGGSVVVKRPAAIDGVDLSKVELLEDNKEANIQDAFERLGVSCENENNAVSKTEGYLISDKRVDSFFNGTQSHEEFRISDEPINPTFTPIRLSRPERQKFNTEEYFLFLKTREIGRTVLYIENASTTMVSIKTIDTVHGAVAVASRQMTPVARGRNSWISPPGCAMFSVVLHLAKGQKISGKFSFLQHIAALSIVRAIRSIHPLLEVSIKWPNDVYYKRDAKIGGILCTCTVNNNGYTCYIGCGVNISNSKPIKCIHELARSTELSVERLIASMLTELERLLDLYERDPQKVLTEYHANWLHSGEEVFVEAVGERAVIQSVDELGFLLAKKNNGELIRLQPDGNSFDLMKGLIFTK